MVTVINPTPLRMAGDKPFLLHSTMTLSLDCYLVVLQAPSLFDEDTRRLLADGESSISCVCAYVLRRYIHIRQRQTLYAIHT